MAVLTQRVYFSYFLNYFTFVKIVYFPNNQGLELKRKYIPRIHGSHVGMWLLC